MHILLWTLGQWGGRTLIEHPFGICLLWSFFHLPAHFFPPRYAAFRETVFNILQHCRNPTD